ncbi:glycosyltransferase family 39 protein [Crocosphaera sp.]|uniref:glycosyltransferase family 39 protein n=1 Tax=Crocosphaera sp. TaxID=2729996 RepID=UPI003F24F802|nr:glycosyltransferase family 39 protein [Crocosphaera sp.]
MKFSTKTINIILLSAIACAVILRVINLGSREFWYDEVLSLLLSTGQKAQYQTPKDAPVILANYTRLLTIPVENSFSDFFVTFEKLLKGIVAEPHPFLFFLEQHFWLRLWGNSEAAMRSLIALFSLSSLGCAYGLGRRLLGFQGGLLFAALLGLNPYYLFHSLNVRMYCSLVFWVLFSSWCLIELITLNTSEIHNNYPKKHTIFWTILLIFSAASGLMTFYYFSVFFLVFAILVLYFDRQKWWKYALYLISSILITIPWVWWGTRQQLRNADLGRFSNKGGFLSAISRHLQEFFDVLGIHLLVGDWSSILPQFIMTVAGFLVFIGLLYCSWSLYKKNQIQLLVIGVLLGLFPLVLMLILDIITGKFTLGFGFGRSVIFVLPGCLLLLVIWLEKAEIKFKNIAILGLLLLYLGINITDFSLRSRRMFHQVADIINEQPNIPTLIIMNSQAWGHVLRLAYYLPPTSPISLLGQKSDKLPPILEQNLSKNSEQYQRIVWLDSERPVWGKPSTEEQIKAVQTILNNDYNLQSSQRLVGTWELDNFNLNVYEKKI